MFVCVCSAVTDQEIVDAVDEGVTSFDDMQDHLDVSKACGSCSCEVKRLLKEKLNASLASRANPTNGQSVKLGLSGS